jgi:hypothetical protein
MPVDHYYDRREYHFKKKEATPGFGEERGRQKISSQGNVT